MSVHAHLSHQTCLSSPQRTAGQASGKPSVVHAPWGPGRQHPAPSHPTSVGLGSPQPTLQRLFGAQAVCCITAARSWSCASLPLWPLPSSWRPLDVLPARLRFKQSPHSMKARLLLGPGSVTLLGDFCAGGSSGLVHQRLPVPLTVP